MANKEIIWLASWPRSGNTLLRTILWQCFGLRSTSLYQNDVGKNKKLEEYVGHLEKSNETRLILGDFPLMKTHELQPDDNPAIYIVRNGKAATISLFQFYKEAHSLESIIEGKHGFGTWSDHLKSWHPWDRKNTLLLKYEDLLSDLPGTLDKISAFLGVKILSQVIPPRELIAGVDGRWVKNESHPKPEFSVALTRKFNEINGEMLKKFGYDL